MLQHTSTIKVNSTKICELLSCSERYKVRSVRDTHLKAGFTLIILSIIIPLSFTQQMILIVALWLLSYGENLSDPES